MRMREPTDSNTGSAARVDAWKRLRPVNQARNGATPRASGSTLRISQQASVSRLVQPAVGIERSSAASCGCQHPHVGQAEIGDQRIAVGQRLLEMLAGIEEDAPAGCGRSRAIMCSSTAESAPKEDTAAMLAGKLIAASTVR